MPAFSSKGEAAGAFPAAVPGQALLGAGCQRRKRSPPEQSFLCFQQVVIQDCSARRPAQLLLETSCPRGTPRASVQTPAPRSRCAPRGGLQRERTLPQHRSRSNSCLPLNVAGEELAVISSSVLSGKR